MRYAGNSIFVDASTARARRAVIHFIFNPFYEASIDGSPTEISSDPLGRMLIELPAGKHQLRLRYDDPYFRIGVQAAWLTLAVLLVLGILRRPYSTKPNRAAVDGGT